MSKISRNDPCPCGSGKKYKKCCARIEQERQKKKRSSGKKFQPFSGGAPGQSLAKKVFKVLSTPMGEPSEEKEGSYGTLEELIEKNAPPKEST